MFHDALVSFAERRVITMEIMKLIPTGKDYLWVVLGFEKNMARKLI